MQLPQYIIDLVGTLLDEGLDDNAICFAAIQAWEEKKLTQKVTQKIT